jgi:UDP-N-acetylglucosamine transferase subunit ALG13
MPRRAALREHRNDHQVYTANKIAEMGLATVAKGEGELAEYLQHLDRLQEGRHARAGQLERLLETLRYFIETGPKRPGGSTSGAL